ncbi:MAG: deoxyribodipyrimidine photo-lyase, partial [Novosphingobium sp.]
FAKAARQHLPQRDPLPAPNLTPPERWPASDNLTAWGLRPARPDWASGLRAMWQAGSHAAQEKLAIFLHKAGAYEDQRNLPSVEGSSRLSPHLHWGEISPGQVWAALEGVRGCGADTFRGELLWRDYAQNVILQFPDYPEASYRDGFGSDFWRRPDLDGGVERDLAAWRQGRTGYPIVDAGMRELWHTGWMHNRVRMIAANFLVKHLLIDWRVGERWFWDTLVDADYANNGVNWQWVAGSGVDANMFTRIMAPLSQSEKFDAAAYIRQWVPELANLDDAAIHDPPPLLRPSGYPDMLVSHREGRERALQAYRAMKADIPV